MVKDSLTIIGTILFAVVIVVALSVLLFTIIRYFVRTVLKFNVIANWVGDSKKRKRIAQATVILCLLGFGIWNIVNTIIVVVHWDVFFFVAELLEKGIRKISGKKSKYYWQGALAIAALILYLGIGYYNAFHVSETNYQLKTSKDIGDKALRVVQISDSHLGTTFDGKGFAKHLEKIQKTNPDIVVVTGDFVDDGTSKEDMVEGCKALGKLKTTYGTYMIWGNHDKGYYSSRNYSLDDVEKELKKNNIKTLKDETVLLGNKIYLIGRLDRSFVERKSADTLVKDLDKSKYMIMLDHQPNDYDAEEKTEVDLVLSGHSHGGQMIPIGITGELSGANDKTYGLEKRNKTTFIVNSGISDWAIYFKTGTFSEYGVIDIANEG